MNRYLPLNPIFVLILTGLCGAPALAAPSKECAPFVKAVANGTATQRLSKFIDTQWTEQMLASPERASYVGYPGQDDRWTDMSAAGIASRKESVRCQLAALQKINRTGLKGEDLMNYDLQKYRLELRIEGMTFEDDYLVIDQLGGLHTNIVDLMENAPKNTKKNYEDRILRLEKTPELEAQIEALLREGSKRKITAVKMFLEKVPGQFDKILTADVKESPIYKPFAQIQAPMTDLEKTALAERAHAVIKEKVYPALLKLRTYLVNDYIPAARTSTALKEMPNGEAWYAYSAKSYTTTKMTPNELHELGLREVDRIGQEMTKLREQLKFKGDVKAFNKFLLTDKRFVYTDKEALLTGFRDIAKRIDPELPKLFKTLPRMTYGVREMPEFKAKEAPAAYYQPGSPETGRPSYFTANTYNLPTRYKWGMETLTIHEAVPGHHLQIAIAKELSNLPKFRRESGYTAFIEGWALYAETLGTEMGFYTDPYSLYGHLSNEMWRACRLVLDTGLHMKGWTRDQAIEYFLEKNVMSRNEAEVEVDRYITWPGQALAYKVGQLKFRELRNLATQELGAKFDVRLFHDEVLGRGALPLDLLEASVKNWIKTQKAAKL